MVQSKSNASSSPLFARVEDVDIGFDTQRFIGKDFFKVEEESKDCCPNHQLNHDPSYSDISECQNHHIGCWHLPRHDKRSNALIYDIEG